MVIRKYFGFKLFTFDVIIDNLLHIILISTFQKKKILLKVDQKELELCIIQLWALLTYALSHVSRGEVQVDQNT